MINMFRKLIKKLGKVLISSNVSWTLLENKEFAEFTKEILNGRYNFPGRTYMWDNVVTPMFDETKERIKNKLKSVIYIALTTDAWTSITQTSYITVTAHFLDEDFKLQNYVLDTTEIT